MMNNHIKDHKIEREQEMIDWYLNDYIDYVFDEMRVLVFYVFHAHYLVAQEDSYERVLWLLLIILLFYMETDSLLFQNLHLWISVFKRW